MLERMIEQMRWANAATLEWLKEDRKDKAAVHRLLYHVINAETVWIRRVRLLPQDGDTFKFRALEDLPAILAANNRDFKELIAEGVSKEFDYVLFDGTPGRSTVLDMILHVYSHSFHHRGQMSAMASKSGEPLPNLAHIQWSRTVGM